MSSSVTSVTTPNTAGAGEMSNLAASWMNYAVDAMQRTVLYWDVMRERSNQYKEHLASDVPHVLNYDAELVLDGRTLLRPVNYILARIKPPDGTVSDPKMRPFVVVDPRAGHGPGIGGFKADSEVGVILKAGHPCYFVGFLPDPRPGQTIFDIMEAEAAFIAKVQALHPDADGKPGVIGNCQAGWAVMMLAAVHPQLFGPIIVAGSPLSYWNGVHGKFPMRYSGGLLGGSWLAALASDMGSGKFDGAWLVQNFENQNPANTLWTKQYNLYSKIDSEVPRYLGFEKWWGGHVNLNAEEIQFIVDELFVGNNLAAGTIRTPDGTAIDLRNIRSPIVVFCSKGDNITPPQQALGWILDLYETTEDIRSFGQTIVYTVHEDVGHLGIFVSGGVGRKEHSEFASNIDMIDTLPPGLYEATFEKTSDATGGDQYAEGEWIMRCEARTLDDIRSMGGNDQTDDLRFATAARVSEMNMRLYRTYAQPFVQALANPLGAEFLKSMHPLRLQYELFSDANPMAAMVKSLASQVRENRRAVSADNPFLKMQMAMSDQIESALDQWREKSEAASEQLFLSMYGMPWLQVAMGLDPHSPKRLRQVAKDPLHAELQRIRIAELREGMTQGSLPEATVRALLYVGLARDAVDERGFGVVRGLRANNASMSLAEFKKMVREQFLMLAVDSEAALSAIPSMLPDDIAQRQQAFENIKFVLSAAGPITGAVEQRLKEVEKLFGVPLQRAADEQAGADQPRELRKAS